MTTLGVTLAFGAGTASASKQVVDFFGSDGPLGTFAGQFDDPRGIAINNSGAGPANPGDIYVADAFNSRIQRFGHDDHGTPADTVDDTYFFISAWGAGVDTAAGGGEYQVCSVAADCGAGIPSDGSGAFNSYYPGDGKGERTASGLAVDEDTGQVYVTDAGNRRVNVYEGDGTFLRSFGFDVVASGPGDSGVGYEVCIAANGDICKAGLQGAGTGQLTDSAKGLAVSQADGNPASGTVFVTDADNYRLSTYNLDGSSPSSIGSSAVFGEGASWAVPNAVAVDSRGIVYADNRLAAGAEETVRYDSENANGGGVGFLAPMSQAGSGFAVDPDSDGAGPDAEILYVLGADGGDKSVFQFGPLNAAGMTAPPPTPDDTHATLPELGQNTEEIAVDHGTGRLYATAPGLNGSGPDGVFILDNAGPPPTASLDSLSDATSSGVIANATIDPNGPPALSYHLEYSLDGSSWKSAPSVVLGSQEDPQSVSALLEPVGGLEPNTPYHVRLFAQRPFNDPIVSPALTFTTLPAPPIVETVGAPLRTMTTARLEGRVTPRNGTTTYYFEYGDQGPCDANPCTATESHSAGAGNEVKLVSQRAGELTPSTTYHYRLVADNGNPGSPVVGADRTVSTRASEAPLSHGRLAGPAGSDRAWEQVNMADTGGNPVGFALNFSDDGNRALFRIAGGTPTSETGSLVAVFFSERSATGWQVKKVTPPRSELRGGDWQQTVGTPDLSSLASTNTDYTTGEAGVWRFGPAQTPSKLFQRSPGQEYKFELGLSADGSRVVALFSGALDPAFPQVTKNNLYDLSSGAPQLVSILPNGKPCPEMEGAIFPSQRRNWISTDGSRVFFTCGKTALYVRNIDTGQSKALSGSTLSGPDCGGDFLKSIPGEAFFLTENRLVVEDINSPGNSCLGGGGDVYSYDFDDGALDCVTCGIASEAANVTQAIVAEDGSRIYFSTATRLAPEAPTGGTYRLTVSGGDLAYVGKVGLQESGLTPDGSVLLSSSTAASLNSEGGQSNGGTSQAYRYDDRDRSLVCVSCPVDGSVPVGETSTIVASEDSGISADGNTLAFSSNSPLVGIDQNTAATGQAGEVGTDVYEWRDGRLLLVTDGLSKWEGGTASPRVTGVSPSGRDIFFLAAAQYTPDALDAYQRLYDARIGGGFEFPKPPPPCPLEVCQGIPKGAPEEQAPGTGAFSGPGNASSKRPASCRKGKVRRKGRCVAKKPARKRHSQRANNDRRTAR